MASPTRERQLETFREEFNPQIDNAYYPACGSDIAPWHVFPDAEIIGVDIDDNSIRCLRQDGVATAHVCDVAEFTLGGNVDALFLLGSALQGIKASDLTASVNSGGYVITDSFIHAGEIAGRQKKDFAIAGRVDKNGVAESCAVKGGEITGLGILQFIQKKHVSPIPIGTICLEIELTMPELFKADLLILKRN